MKTNLHSIQLILFLFFSIPSLAQLEIESTFANASSVRSTDIEGQELHSASEDAYTLHTAAAQDAIRIHLESSLTYTELLIEQGVVGRVILRLEIDSDGNICGSGIHQSLSMASDATALHALDGLELPNGPYFGASSIHIPVDFVLE